jgi:hypothetical protein
MSRATTENFSSSVLVGMVAGGRGAAPKANLIVPYFLGSHLKNVIGGGSGPNNGYS